MLAGLIIIIAGVFIALYPPFLSLIVSVLLIVIGVLIVASAWHRRRLARHSGESLIRMILRY
jgi:purine-cytosine permease-like protein|tara:strand:+ start:1266 stop:1451 length:186 start_codon:yes stop_codon:yes gene_type:complete